MTIENHNGTIVITGDSIPFAHLLTLRGALRLEVAGMRGRFNAHKILKDEYGFKGNRAQMLVLVNQYIEKHK